MSELDVSICGFGDNVVDVYEHVRTEYPGGNCVNFAVYGKKAGVRRAAYMGYFGSDARAERVIKALHEEGVETVSAGSSWARTATAAFRSPRTATASGRLQPGRHQERRATSSTASTSST